MNSKYILISVFFLLMSCSSGLIVQGTSDDSGDNGTSGALSLSQFPDLSTLVDNSSASVSRSLVSDLKSAVVGQAPEFTDITSDNVAGYFFPEGLLETDPSTLSDDASRSAFIETAKVGLAKCQLVDASAQSFAITESAATSFCYMKRVADPELADITITPSTVLQETLFDKGASDKLIQAVISGAGPGDSSEDIFIKVLADAANRYNFYLFTCDNGAVQGYEHGVLDADDVLTFSHGGSHNSTGSVTQMQVQANVTEATDGTFVIDTSQPRTMTVRDSQTSGLMTSLFALNMAISSTQIELMAASESQSLFDTFRNKVYMLTDYTGTTFSDLVFPSAAMALRMGLYRPGGSVAYWEPDNATIGMEYREDETPKYATVTDTEGYTLASQAGFSFSGSFTSNLDSSLVFNYAATAEPENDIEQTALSASFSCADTPDITVTMDFTSRLDDQGNETNPNVRIQNDCEPRVSRDEGGICSEAWAIVEEVGQSVGDNWQNRLPCTDEATCSALLDGTGCNPSAEGENPTAGNSWNYSQTIEAGTSVEQMICLTDPAYMTAAEVAEGCIEFSGAVVASINDDDACGVEGGESWGGGGDLQTCNANGDCSITVVNLKQSPENTVLATLSSGDSVTIDTTQNLRFLYFQTSGMPTAATVSQTCVVCDTDANFASAREIECHDGANNATSAFSQMFADSNNIREDCGTGLSDTTFPIAVKVRWKLTDDTTIDTGTTFQFNVTLVNP